MKNRSVLLVGWFILCLSTNLNSQNSEMDLLLDLGIEELLNTKIVSASKTAQNFSTIAASVKVITATEIHQRGYQSLQDILSDLPGFQFRDIQGFNSYVFQHGIPNQNNLTLLMIDGVQVNELNSGGFYGGMHFNLENIEQVEIIYGPASALYGTNALTGIINLITKKAVDNQGLDVHASAGSFNTYKIGGGYGYYNPEKDAGMRVSARYLSTDKTPLDNENGDNNWTSEIDNFEKDIAADLSANWKNLSFGFNIQNKQSSRATLYNSQTSAYSDHGTSWNILFANAQIKYKFEKKKYSLIPQIYYRNSTVLPSSIAEINDNEQYAYYRPGSLAGIDLLNKFQIIDKLLVTGGLILENEELSERFGIAHNDISEPEKPVPPRPSMTTNHLFSVYGQAEYTFLKHLTSTAGFRYDYSDYYGEKLTPRFSLSFRKGVFSTSLLYNEAYRAPKPWDYTTGYGNPDLKPELIQTTEWVSNVKIGSHMLFSAAIYRSYMYNIFVQNYDYYPGFRWVNQGKIYIHGLEAEWSYRHKKLDAYINFSYTKPVDELKTLLPEISETTANAGIYYRWNAKLSTGMRLNYSGERKNASTGRHIINQQIVVKYYTIDPYIIAHLDLSYAITKAFQASLFVNNLTDQKYYHSSNRQPDRYPQARRSVRLQLSYLLK